MDRAVRWGYAVPHQSNLRVTSTLGEEGARQKHSLTLVILTPTQIERAKEANGQRKRITHAVLCGPHGQMFGTQIQCLKYFRAWDPDRSQPIFPSVFDRAIVTSRHEITDFHTTPDLVLRLFEIEDAQRPPVWPEVGTNEPEAVEAAKGGCMGVLVAIGLTLGCLVCLSLAAIHEFRF